MSRVGIDDVDMIPDTVSSLLFHNNFSTNQKVADATNTLTMPLPTTQSYFTTLSSSNQSEDCPHDTLTYTCRCYDFIIEAVLMGALCLFGFAGNTVSMICLWHDRAKTATPFLLVSLEVADTLFLVTVFILRVLTSIESFGYNMPALVAAYPYFAKFVYPCALITETGAIYLTILVTLNRYISVCFPYRATDLCSVYYARIHVAIVAAFSIIFNLPRFFEYDIVTAGVTADEGVGTTAGPDTLVTPPDGEVGWAENATGLTGRSAGGYTFKFTELQKSQTYQIVYTNLLYFLVMFFIPLVSLMMLNQRLVVALQQTKRRRAQMLKKSRQASDTSSSRSEDDITFMLIVVVMVFVVTQTPAMITQVLGISFSSCDQMCPYMHFYYVRISDLLVVANSSLNFVIYCFCSRRIILLWCVDWLELVAAHQ